MIFGHQNRIVRKCVFVCSNWQLAIGKTNPPFWLIANMAIC
jgi:hypothetical protein